MEKIIKGRHSQPHSILGMHEHLHEGKKGVVVRAWLNGVESCEVVDLKSKPEKRYPMGKCDPAGFFEVFIPERSDLFKYRLSAQQSNGEIRQFADPYSFWPTLSEDDVYLINEGTNYRIYDKLGAHLRTVEGVKGVTFAVWAPSAKRVSVVGDFNHWNGLYHPMRMLGNSGIWELFIPGLEKGAKYKFEVISPKDDILLKTDPYGKYFESPPHNASIVYEYDNFAWSDQSWVDKRAKTNWKQEPVSIYEIHMGSWKRHIEDGGRPFSYREMAKELTNYVLEMGFTHVEFMPLAEHPFDGSWGYQVTGFYAPTYRFGTPEDFMYLVDTLHRNDIGVIIDWVPGHFPRDTFALADFDGTHLYNHADPRQGEHRDWGTLIFNYGRKEVFGFLIGSALAWFERFHIDGMRVDAVASMLYLDYSRKEGDWIPNKHGGRENLEAIDFLRTTNDVVHQYYPGAMMIAEESTSWGGVSRPTAEGGLGFDFKWNMGWMHDTLYYFSKDPIYRRWEHNNLTFAMLYQYTENFALVFSHDEVVHGKQSLMIKMGAEHIWEKARTLRALYGFMWSWPGKKTLFMGSEFGQSAEWRYDSSLDWHLLQYADHKGIRAVVKDLNTWYKQSDGVASLDCDSRGFQWINSDDAENSVLSYLRCGKDASETWLVVGNFTPVLRKGYRIGVPHDGFWKEVFNSEAECYGGCGEGNMGGQASEPVENVSRPHSLCLTLPPMSTLIFKYEGKVK